MRNYFPERLIKLANCFPALANAPLTGPQMLWDWAQTGERQGSEFHAAVFILNIYNCVWAKPIGHSAEQWPPFDLFGAYAVWDSSDFEAFLAWTRKPWCV